MNFLKKSTFFLLALISISAALTSCKEEEEDTQIPTGNIKAAISFTPTQDTSTCWRRYLQGLNVELVNKDNGEVLRINNTSTKANLDYGQYPYGNYQIRVIGYVREGNICTSFDKSHSEIDTIQVFTLNAPTKTINFNLTNK